MNNSKRRLSIANPIGLPPVRIDFSSIAPTERSEEPCRAYLGQFLSVLREGESRVIDTTLNVTLRYEVVK
jgi:hypothetical protein